MAYLKGFGLENFRVFKEYTWFDFAPITILVGPNSSGKSSLIKALLLLKDNYDRHKLKADNLYFDGPLHSLSSGKSVIGHGDKKNIFSFYVPHNISSLSASTQMRFSYRNVEHETKLISKKEIILSTGELLQYQRNNVHFFFNLQLFAKLLYKGPYLESSSEDKYDARSKDYAYFTKELVDDDGNTDYIILRKYYGEKYLNGINLHFTKWSDFFIEVDRYNKKNTYNEVDKRIKEILISDFINEDFDLWIKVDEDFDFPDGSIAGLLRKNGYPEKKGQDSLGNLIQKLLKINEPSVIEAFSTIIYLPSVKGQSRRWYSSGEEELLNRLIKDYFKNQVCVTPEEEDSLKLANLFLTNWAEKFGLDNFFIKREDKFDLNFVEANNLSLTDQGYGFSQIAATLLAIHKAICLSTMFDDRNGQIVILEEPESNLHPKFQSMLADMLVEAATLAKGKELGIQFIVETHSEYIIRKLQYLTAKGESLKENDTVLYYFNDPNSIPVGEKQVKKINILEDGSLSDDFGPGFYDEAATWELELLRLKRNKNRQN